MKNNFRFRIASKAIQLYLDEEKNNLTKDEIEEIEKIINVLLTRQIMGFDKSMWSFVFPLLGIKTSDITMQLSLFLAEKNI